jgi:16S rRNA (adenine1518-N6/adenine1519-N6)-dimethyltransferase
VSAPLLTPADVRRLLAEHGLAPRRARGQNFVVDPNTVRKIVRDAGVGPDDLVCEVGAGLGSLTLALRAAGARVVALEIDPGLVRALRAVVGDDPGVRIVEADAVRVDYGALLGAGRAVLVANLPYNVATPVVITALTQGAFAHLFVMVQREVGERWAAGPGHPLYGAVSVKVAALADARLAGRVSRRAFHPVPRVDSVTVRLVPRPWAAPVPRAALFALVEAGFAQRRKQLRNALATAARPPGAVEQALRTAGLSSGARAEELDVGAWGALAHTLERA